MKKQIVIKTGQKRFLPLIWFGEETELSYSIFLAGPGAEVDLLLLLLGKDNAGLAANISVYHQKSATKCRIFVRGALAGAARVDFTGLVKIEPGAVGSNAWLAAHLLLISPQATGRVVPNMEIAENDVTAGHAASVGRINDLELFYLQSRGLSRSTATDLIVRGFLAGSLDRFPQRLADRARKELSYL